MKTKAMRLSLLILILSFIGAFFQNCSPPVNFKAADSAVLDSLGSISGQPQLPCSDGQPDGTVRWDEVVGQTFTSPALTCLNGGNLTDVFAKLEKFVCSNGQYISANEFKNGTQLPSTGGCDCAGGLINGTANVVKTNPSDSQTCSPGTGTIVSNYEESTTKLCNNGAIETTTSKIMLNQSGTCTCESGTAAGSIVSKTISTNNIEKQSCEFGGTLSKSFDLSQNFLCSANFDLLPQGSPTQINVQTTGSCNPPPLKTEDLVIDQIKTTEPLDMIWVIDNSGSMSEEAAQVRINLEKFLTSLNVSSDSNMKFLLVSTTKSTVTQTAKYCLKYPKDQGCSERAVSLPSGLDASKFTQIDFSVDSWSGPSLLIRKLQQLDSASAPFFRKNSKKIVVFVTDDNSTRSFIDTSVTPNIAVSAISAIEFSAALNMLTNVSSGETSFFGFIGLGNDPNKVPYSSCQAATGLVYKTLSANNNGAVFNICDTDWTSHFADLKTNVQTKLGRSYKLTAQNVTSVVKIVVDNNTILADPANFSFDPASGILTLTDKVIFSATSTITVYYN